MVEHQCLFYICQLNVFGVCQNLFNGLFTLNGMLYDQLLQIQSIIIVTCGNLNLFVYAVMKEYVINVNCMFHYL